MKKNSWQKRLVIPLLAFAVIGAFNGCRPDVPDYIEDYDLVYTVRKDGFNFNSLSTYMMPDSVSIPDGSASDHRFDDDILSAVDRNMQANGWTKVAGVSGNKADIIILVGANKNETTTCTSWCWDCWYWWPGWGGYPPYPGWGWGYPGSMVCATLRTGSVVINFAYPNGAENNSMPSVWVAAINGLLDGTDASKVARINNTIDQAFDQSPYLKD